MKEGEEKPVRTRKRIRERSPLTEVSAGSPSTDETVSPRTYVCRAVGNLSPEHFRKSELHEPLETYIRPGERPHYFFESSDEGLILEGPDWNDSRAPYDSEANEIQANYVLVTDRRVLSVMSEEKGDVAVEIPYDDLVDAHAKIRILDSRLILIHEDGDEISFYGESVEDQWLENASEYIRKQIPRISITDGTESRGHTTEEASDPDDQSSQGVSGLEGDPNGRVPERVLDGYGSARPIGEYLRPSEQPHYYFHNEKRGLVLEHPDWEKKKAPFDDGDQPGEANRHLLITDQRVLFVAGGVDTDEVVSYPYSDLVGTHLKTGMTAYRLVVTDSRGRDISFYGTRDDEERDQLESAESYVEDQIEGEDTNCDNCRGDLDPNGDFCPGCGTPVDFSAVVDSDGESSTVDTEGTFCPQCGGHVREGEDTCSDCEVRLPAVSRLNELLSTGEKDHRSGVMLARFFPPIALWIAHRQESIENAQRKLIEYKNQFETEDVLSVNCRSCGTQLLRQTHYCPECGQENELASIEYIDFDVNDPAEHRSSASNFWWCGMLGGALLAYPGFPIADAAGLGVVGLLFVIAGGTLATLSAIFDARYLRANGPWGPSDAWAALMWIPGVSLLLTIPYLALRLWKFGPREFGASLKSLVLTASS